MRGVLLVGGEGTRLRPLTYSIPKPMVPVGNKPFLEHVISLLKKHKIEELILALCYFPDRIIRYFGEGERFGMKMHYRTEPFPLGTGGAVRNVKDLVGEETFAVLNGDIFTDIDLSAMLEFHKERRAWVTIAMIPVEDPSPFGVIVTDERGRILRFVEKPPRELAPSNLINAGVYLMEPHVLERIPPGVFSMLERDLFPSLAEEGAPIYGFEARCRYWIDIGTPERYLDLNLRLLSDGFIPSSPPEGIEVEGPVALGEGNEISPKAKIKGPAVVGSRCEIEEGVIIEEAVIWDEVRIGRGAHLRRCIIASRCRIGEGTVVEEGAVLGEGVIVPPESRLGPGTKLRGSA